MYCTVRSRTLASREMQFCSGRRLGLVLISRLLSPSPFRVALQWEFSALGLDECLERLRHHESEELSVQVCLLFLFLN